MILKVSHNIRLTADMNISFAIEGIVDNEEEADAMGVESARYLKRYTTSFGNEFDDKNGDDDEEDDDED